MSAYAGCIDLPFANQAPEEKIIATRFSAGADRLFVGISDVVASFNPVAVNLVEVVPKPVPATSESCCKGWMNASYTAVSYMGEQLYSSSKTMMNAIRYGVWWGVHYRVVDAAVVPKGYNATQWLNLF